MKERLKRATRALGAVVGILLALLILTASRQPGPAALTADALSLREWAALLFESCGEPKASFDLEAFTAELPQYAGEPALVLNEGVPLFTAREKESLQGVSYSELDGLGRCGAAVARLGPETLATEERGAIGAVKPTGWHTVRYDDRIEDRYLYNRCHLIGYQLAGENAEARNLITGTRYLNTTGMLPYENAVLAYIRETGNHVLYRVTPVFVGDDLVASGVLMEACSVEDRGAGIRFFVYLFNVQPGVIIAYRTGDSRADDAWQSHADASGDAPDGTAPPQEAGPDEAITYVLNTNTMRFHDPSCPFVADIKERNKASFTGTRDEALALGYQPCGRCRP